MHSNKEPRRFAGELSTEDLARSTPDGPARTEGEREATGSRPPVYPGESTGGTTAARPTRDPATSAGIPSADPSADPSDPAAPAETTGAADAAGRVDTARAREPLGAGADATTAPDTATGPGRAGAAVPTGTPDATGTSGVAGTSDAAGRTDFAGTADTRDAKPAADADDELPRLLDATDEQSFRDRWRETQSKFVDDPRDAVHSADTLVADVIRTLAATFAEHKQGLEGQWSQGEQVDTEELRRALRRYRSFFNRLLST
ncbi:hypothetical protein [Streptomyces similanensis]|uniref:Uncharacterized protein n=1 Tax=Streptomyces similanensis TaxID=1274988 RepID=A0ABP9KJ09_9ACTN